MAKLSSRGFTGLSNRGYGSSGGFGSAFSGMGRATPSGRNYWGEERYNERFAKAKLMQEEEQAFGGGGRGRSGGGGGGGMMMPPQGLMSKPGMMPPPMTPQQMADIATVTRNNNPSMGQEYANAQARVQGNKATIHDFTLLEKFSNPTAPQTVAQAMARLRMGRRNLNTWGGKPTLVNAAQGALFG